MDRQLEPELMDLPEEARAYARGTFPEVSEAVVARLVQLADETYPGRADLKLVDLGTGPGSIPVLISRTRPAWHITAVDAAKAMLVIAQVGIKMAGLADRVRILLADAKSTGLPDHSFDIVFCNSLVHHMPDPVPLWKEIKRLAAPGGLIFVRDLMRPETPEGARALVNKHMAGQGEMLHEEFYRSLLAAFRIEEVRQHLAAAGLPFLQVQPLPDRHLDVFGVVPAA